ncbi:SDR family oxidoreductase [Acidimangrovimonas sediminis]|uniref:SDR family oxidoreductase n=1 Tax=Acidimangrovimonas sediminis TaxID=2056283 RepID=UPI000C8043C3|nr:SDR family oxidoreductase [Acidimangrovimonas sediminis]
MKRILIIGASRGIGHSLACEFVTRGWQVTGTIRGTAATPLHALRDAHPQAVEIERVDINFPDQVAALKSRLTGQAFDALLVNAGTSNANQGETIAETTTDEFIRVMVTNALSPMRVVEVLSDLLTPEGILAVMSSGQGSIAENTRGGREVYRGSKAALNQYMRSYAIREGETRPMLLIAPGWIRTELGGDDARYSLGESAPKLVDVILAQEGKPGLRYEDRDGKTVAW